MSEKQLVDFGNYLLSEERNALVSDINKNCVTHADIQNWKAANTNKRITEIADAIDAEAMRVKNGTEPMSIGTVHKWARQLRECV